MLVVDWHWCQTDRNEMPVQFIDTTLGICSHNIIFEHDVYGMYNMVLKIHSRWFVKSSCGIYTGYTKTQILYKTHTNFI